MFHDYRDAAFESKDSVPVQLFLRRDTGCRSPASRPEPAVEPDRTVLPAASAIPGPDAVRALLILAAESAFDLQDGAKDSKFVSNVKECGKDLEKTLASLSLVGKGADYSLMFRRARQAVAMFNETVHREILEEIDEDTEMDELDATLQVVKAAAIEAGKALKLIEIQANQFQ